MAAPARAYPRRNESTTRSTTTPHGLREVCRDRCTRVALAALLALFATGRLPDAPVGMPGPKADTLGADLSTLDGVVISHSHPDHVGGMAYVLRRTFHLSPDRREPSGLPAYVPVQLRHERAEVQVTTEPRVIAPGVALLPPIPRVLFWGGPVFEQSLVVNVRGFGLVLVSGCGHPSIERMLAATERVLDVPIKAVVGGLHLPVHPRDPTSIVQSVVGSPYWPWKIIGEEDVRGAIDVLRERGPRIVALSGHDSTPWTYEAMAQAFGDGYRTLRVGEELTIA
jgi:7,8-dihydropterin-6-yl-methyl-4-(beta-D-ribofuranosyl)aminobenzene 5'-phosphate synthase